MGENGTFFLEFWQDLRNKTFYGGKRCYSTVMLQAVLKGCLSSYNVVVGVCGISDHL